MKIYISSSWKQRDRVRALAIALEEVGHDVYDFTNPKKRTLPEIPPERFPMQFDPAIHNYREYLSAVPEWQQAVLCNKAALESCDLVVLLLPCGLDAHADAFYGLGRGARLVVVGHPQAGERVPTHLWAEELLDEDSDVLIWIKSFRVKEYDQ